MGTFNPTDDPTAAEAPSKINAYVKTGAGKLS